MDGGEGYTGRVGVGIVFLWGGSVYGLYGVYGLTCVRLCRTVRRMAKLTVRSQDEELAAWKEAAWLRKTSLSDWVRKVLNANAAKTKEEQGG